MSPGDSSGPSDGIDIQALLESVMPKLTAILAHSPLTPERTDALLDETVRSLLLQWPKIDDPRKWLLETLERSIDHEAEHGPRRFPRKSKDRRAGEEPDEDLGPLGDDQKD